MTDEPKTPPDSSETPASEGDDQSRSAETAPGEQDDKAAASGEAVQSPPAPPSKPAAAPSSETPEEKKARLERIIAEAKAKKEAAAAAQAEGGEAASPSQADVERAAKIAEAKARAAALKESAAAKAPAATPAASKPAATTAAAGAAGAGVPKAPVKKKDEGPKPADASDNPLVKRLRQRLGDEAVKGAFSFLGQLSIQVKAESIVAACLALRDDAEMPFNYLSDLTCVHWPERDEAPFELVYNLYSIPRNERVRVKAAAGDSIDSVTSVWPTANWMEREVYDLFGVRFNDHPDLRRILLPTDWDGHPLRKDYPLEFMENEWTARRLPEFTEVQREQLEQRRAYGLEILQTPDERRIRELFRDSRDPLPKEHK